MSTKIYHGHEFPDGDLIAAISHLHGLRAEVAQEGARLIARRMAALAVRRFDAAIRIGRPCPSPLSGALVTMLEEQSSAESGMRRDPMWDTRASVVLIPAEERVLALPYAEMPEIRAIITRGLTPLPWWDNTDRPDEVTEEGWAETGRLWSAALSADPLGRPSGCGVTVEFLGGGGLPSIEDALDNLPPDEERAEAIFRPEFVERNLENRTIEEVTRLMAEARTAPERREMIAEIRRGLIPITREVLLNGTAAS